MRIVYHTDIDLLWIQLVDDFIYGESENLSDSVIVDYDEEGKIAAIEIHGASKIIETDPDDLQEYTKGATDG